MRRCYLDGRGPAEALAWVRSSPIVALFSTCDGLIFDTDRFLDSPAFWVEEVNLGDEVALLVASQ